MDRLTFYLCSTGVIDGNLRQKGQDKSKRAGMSSELAVRDRSVRSMLLRTLIEMHAHGKAHL